MAPKARGVLNDGALAQGVEKTLGRMDAQRRRYHRLTRKLNLLDSDFSRLATVERIPDQAGDHWGDHVVF